MCSFYSTGQYSTPVLGLYGILTNLGTVYRLVYRKCHNCASMNFTANFVILGIDKHIKAEGVFDFILLFGKENPEQM